MSETTELKTAVEIEVRGEQLLKRMTMELDAFIAKAKGAVAATSGKMAGVGADLAKGQERANEAVRRGLGLRVQAERQRADTANAERQDIAGLDSATVRTFRMQLRMRQQQQREAVTAERARETAARAAERQAERASRVIEAAAVRRQRAEAAADRRRETDARTADRERQRADARQERDRETAVRRAIGLDNYRMRLRERWQRQEQADHDREHRGTVRQGREAWRRGREGYSGAVRPAGAAAVIGVGAATAATRRVLRAEGDVDAAEIGTRQYGGLDAKGARELRDRWAAPTAEALGVGPDKLLNAWTDATKLGIPAKDAQGFAELATKTSEAWGVPFEKVTDTLGTVNSLLTAKGDPFSMGRMQSVANTLQHLAAKQSTTPEKMISFLQRGAGGADVLGMSMEGGLAFGSASTSLGNQAGQSGRMLDYIAGRVIDMPRIARKKGEQGDEARETMRRLGYGSAENMDRMRRADPDAFLPDLMERFSKITNTKHQDKAIKFFAGQEWLGEFGRMVKGAETYKEAQKLAKEAKGFDAIGEVWNLHKFKLNFVAKQFSAGWSNILGELGKEISPLARQAGDFFLEWTGKLRAGGLRERFKALLDGLLEGLGVKNLPELLRNIFGDPKDATGGSVEAWKAAAKGFGEGIRDVVGSILGVAKMLTGGDADPEKLGRLTAQVLGFGLALVVVAPFVSVLGAMGSALMGLALAAGAAWKVMQGLGIVGAAEAGKGAGAAAGAAGAAGGAAGAKGGKLAALGRLFGLYGAAEAAREFGALQAPDTSKGWGRSIIEGLDPGLASRLYGDGATGTKPPAGTPDPSSHFRDLETLRQSLQTIDPNLAQRLFPDGAVVQRQSAGEDWRGLIHPAVADGDGGMPGPSEWRAAGRVLGDGFLDRARRGLGVPGGDGFPGSSRTTDAIERMARSAKAFEARMRLEPFYQALDRVTGGSSASSSGTYGGQGGGISPNDPAQRYGKRFFTVRGGVPGFGGGGGSASSNPANSAASAAMLDAIAGTESGKAGYDAVLGNGKYGTPSKPVSTMTLDEAFAFGRQIKSRHGSSSALGRYQIVGNTMRAAQAAMGISGDATFDQAMQDRMARWIARNQGLGAWEGLKSNPGAMAHARAAMAQGGAHDAPAGAPATSIGNAGFGGREQYEGLRLKSVEAIAGGAVAKGVTDLARSAQADLPGGVARFTAFNDAFHHRVNPRSLHTRGLAFDTALSDPRQHVAAAEAMRAKLRAAGLTEDMFRVIDEYARPSGHATGGHLHTQFNSAEAAQRYHDFLAPSADMVAKAKEGRGRAAIDAEASAPPSVGAQNAVRNVPLPPQRPAGLGGGGGRAGSGVVVHQTINGYDKSPKEIADMAQRHITETWNNRGHDLEAELA